MALKNEHIKNLNHEVPKQLRINVYKQAIYHIKNDIPVANIGIYGLCLVLPCLLWGFESTHQSPPDGERWDFGQTPKAFPELTDEIMDELTFTVKTSEKNKKRIKYLQQFVHDLEETPFYIKWRNLFLDWCLDMTALAILGPKKV